MTTRDWNPQSIRRARHRDRQGHRALLSPSPRTRIPRLSARDRTHRSGRSRCPSRHGQLRHPHDPGDPKVARTAAQMACSLHPDREFMGQSRRALLRRHHRKANPPRRPSLRAEAETAIRAYIDAVNDDPKPFRWTKSADDILAAIKRSCLKTLEIASAQIQIARNSESGR
jgi:hypothetical protein